MSIKLDRLNNKFMEEISRIVNNEARDENLGFVTITAVKITNDLSYAKVYFTTLTDKEASLKTLNKACSFIRTTLANRVKIRKMPILEFVYDQSIEYGKKIENIIERIKENE